MSKVIVKGKNYQGVVSFQGVDLPDTLKVELKKNNKDDFYNIFYTKNHLEKTRKYQASLILKKLEKVLFSSNSILEIGCGDGLFVDELVQTHQGNVLGIDPYLKEESKNKIKCGLYEFNGDQFKSVILLDVFEHFENNLLALEKIKSHICDDGFLIIKVPNKNALFYRISKMLSFFNTSSLSRLYQIDFPPQHFYYYNKRSLCDLCEKAGLKYVKHFYMSEVPLKGLYNRLWGLSLLVKIIAVPFAFLYNMIAQGSLKDSVVICFRKETPPA